MSSDFLLVNRFTLQYVFCLFWHLSLYWPSMQVILNIEFNSYSEFGQIWGLVTIVREIYNKSLANKSLAAIQIIKKPTKQQGKITLAHIIRFIPFPLLTQRLIAWGLKSKTSGDKLKNITYVGVSNCIFVFNCSVKLYQDKIIWPECNYWILPYLLMAVKSVPFNDNKNSSQNICHL